MAIIYGRTLVKLAFGHGGLAQRLVPDVYDVSKIPPFKTLLNFLNSTHVFVGIAAIAVILLHMAIFSAGFEKCLLCGACAIFDRNHDRHLFGIRASAARRLVVQGEEPGFFLNPCVVMELSLLPVLCNHSAILFSPL